MPIAPFEKAILRLLAANRNPESYVVGVTILLRREDSQRRSQDVDLFHDTADSLKLAAEADAAVLTRHGYEMIWDNVQPTFRRALVSRDGQTTKLEWVFDSAFRFFPVERDEEFGYVLNFWDAATNKVLALAGRGDLRNYLYVLALHGRNLSLGALDWAAAGKEAGFTPQFLLEEAQRLAHYPVSRLAEIQLREPVDLKTCKKAWLTALADADALLNKLPAEEVGCLYLDADNQPVTPNPAVPEFAKLKRHFGSVRGAWPVINGSS